MSERMWNSGTLTHCWWEYKLEEPLGKIDWQYLTKLNIRIPYDSEMPLLGL